ncbi:hypothetical protein, partial [Acetobacter conturbans]|uniref:hypothetical protein n=1 Tax=Acetobacter conturbans TaxID=1737472 RepID=UPI0038D14612
AYHCILHLPSFRAVVSSNDHSGTLRCRAGRTATTPSHGAGANTTDTVRQGINITYAVGWVRQEENQYLATPPEIARTLPDDLLKLMGYQCGCFAIGYVRDFEDPLAYLKGSTERHSSGFNALSKTANEVSTDYAKSLS